MMRNRIKNLFGKAGSNSRESAAQSKDEQGSARNQTARPCFALRTRSSGRRPSFTLIELLIVIGLIVVITVIGIITIPLFPQQQQATGNSTQIVAWLGGAKAKALSQQRPTGLRLVPDPGNPNWIREL